MVELGDKFKLAFNHIKQNLSEHLSAINENTSELQSFFDYIQEIETKIDKLSERIDGIQLSNQENSNEQPYIAPLNNTEKKIFLVLYTEFKPLDCIEISHRSEVPLSIIREHIASLIQKGIPLKRTFNGNQTSYQLDQRFKEWQAKENIINLSLTSFINKEVNEQTKLRTYIKE